MRVKMFFLLVYLLYYLLTYSLHVKQYYACSESFITFYRASTNRMTGAKWKRRERPAQRL